MQPVQTDLAAMVRTILRVPPAPRCGYCNGPLIFARDIECGFHTEQHDAYSCRERALEIAQ